MRKVKGILIDPFACTVTEVEHDADHYQGIYDLISHESMKVGTFTCAYSDLLKPGDAIFVDDDGLLKHCERFFQIAGHPQPLAGKGLVLGSDDEGDTVSCKTSLDIVRMSVVFAERVAAGLLVTRTPWEKSDA
jgi:hypothetical protein